MWFAITVTAIWICSTIGVIKTKDTGIYVITGIVTVFIGIGYLLIS